MKTIISRKDLADRWDVSTTTIDQWEQSGIIHRLNMGAYYGLDEVMKLETIGKPGTKTLREKTLENEVKKLNDKIADLESFAYEVVGKFSTMIGGGKAI